MIFLAEKSNLQYTVVLCDKQLIIAVETGTTFNGV